MDKSRIVKAAATLKEFCKRNKDVCTKCMFYDEKGVGNYCRLYGVPHVWKHIATPRRHGKEKTWKGEDADGV